MREKIDMLTGLITTLNDKEIDRRIDIIKALMEKEKVGILLICSIKDEGYIRWITGKREFGNPSREVLLISKDGISTDLNNIREIFSRYKYKNIGVVHVEQLLEKDYQYLKKELADVSIVDLSEQMRAIKSIKSKEELIAINNAVQLQIDILDALRKYIKIGQSEQEIVRYVRYIGNCFGSGGIDHRVSAQVELTAIGREEEMPAYLEYPGRFIKAGDFVTVKLCFMGDSGYYGMIARAFSIGEPSHNKKYNWNEARNLQCYLEKHVKPGVTIHEIEQQQSLYAKKRGIIVSGQAVHGMGYVCSEAPNARFGYDSLPIKEGMILAIEPRIVDNKGVTYCCGDTYVVTKTGCEKFKYVDTDILVL